MSPLRSLAMRTRERGPAGGAKAEFPAPVCGAPFAAAASMAPALATPPSIRVLRNTAMSPPKHFAI
jgi:hypothetical protein